MTEETLSKNDLDSFQQWLNLNMFSITWEGRYLNKFESFWDNFFKSEEQIKNYFLKFEYAKRFLKTGPLASWMNWLNEKFICYLFLKKGFTLLDLSNDSQQHVSDVALIIRNFLIQKYPHLLEVLNDVFQIGNFANENIFISFTQLKNKIEFTGEVTMSSGQDVMNDLEVTLYPEWDKFVETLLVNEKEENVFMEKLKEKTSFKKLLRFLQEMIALFLIGGVLIFGLRYVNSWYEEYLSGKISLYEPNFFWMDDSLDFERIATKSSEEIKLNIKDLEELERIESKNIFGDKAIEGKRYEAESDVVLTSIDSLPRDLDVVNLEQSEYEEEKKGGYRDTYRGRRKSYRILMNSVNPKETQNRLNRILKDFAVEQVDQVKPGTKIPGGYYSNLYVPRNRIKEFLLKVSKIEKVSIFESRRRFGGKKDKNKVFIWIKSI